VTMVAVSDDKFAATRNPVRAIRKRAASRRRQIELPPGPVGRPLKNTL
jgi:hypothetical protein